MTRVVTLGEILLRLKSPQFERLFQSPLLEATFGGGEANVAVSLAHFGLDAVFVTVLPANAIGDAALAELHAERRRWPRQQFHRHRRLHRQRAALLQARHARPQQDDGGGHAPAYEDGFHNIEN